MHPVLRLPRTLDADRYRRLQRYKSIKSIAWPKAAALRSEVLLQLQPAAGHAAVTAAALHLAESGKVPFRFRVAHGSASNWQAAEAVKLVEHLAQSGQRGGVA